jgi:hypothetical protein
VQLGSAHRIKLALLQVSCDSRQVAVGRSCHSTGSARIVGRVNCVASQGGDCRSPSPGLTRATAWHQRHDRSNIRLTGWPTVRHPRRRRELLLPKRVLLWFPEAGALSFLVVREANEGAGCGIPHEPTNPNKWSARLLSSPCESSPYSTFLATRATQGILLDCIRVNCQQYATDSQMQRGCQLRLVEPSLPTALPRRVVPVDIDLYTTLFERFDDAIP